MSDSSTISGAVQLGHSSMEEVAFKLMEQIGRYETDEHQNRKYWLTLYRQCYKATSGLALESVLKPE